MENLTLLRNPYFCYPAPYCSILPYDPLAEVWVKPLSEFNMKYSGGIDCFFIHADPCIMIMKSSVKVQLDLVSHL